MALPTPTMRTERLLLRPFIDADADALWALHTSPRVLEFWDSPPWTDRARVAAFLARNHEREESGTGARVAVEDADGFVGWCSLAEYDATHRSASLGYVYAEAVWGRGYATEAARALLDWGYAALDLNRVQAQCDTRNVASARVLEKLGFTREGTLREDCVVDGVVSDSHVYGLFRREWAPAGS